LSGAFTGSRQRYTPSVARLTAADIRHALVVLSRDLEEHHVRAELLLVGGAAMVLLYGARTSTKDVDAWIECESGRLPVVDAARRVAAELDLPQDWLNDAAKGFIQGYAEGETLLECNSLRVRTLGTRQLLAMKLAAWRDDVDIEDARLLLSSLPGTREEVWALVAPFIVPGRDLKARYAFEDLWESSRGSA